MHIGFWCEVENKATWLGCGMMVLGVIELIYFNGISLSFQVTSIMTLTIPGSGLVYWTSYSTPRYFEKAYRGMLLRDGVIDKKFESAYLNYGFPCVSAGYRVALRKWRFDHPGREIVRE